MTRLAMAISFLLLIPCLAWAQAPATQPAASPTPVVKDGLSIALTLPTATFAADEPLTFTVQFKNVSQKPLSLCDADHFWAWRIWFWDAHAGGTWQFHKLFFEDKKRVLSLTSLNPGQTLDVPVVLDSESKQFEYKWDGAEADPLKILPRLSPGQYRLSIGIRFAANPARPAPSPYWTGSISPRPVEFQVAAK
jgi:hypothetical protein